MAEFDILYGTGISKIGEIIDICVDTEVIKNLVHGSAMERQN